MKEIFSISIFHPHRCVFSTNEIIFINLEVDSFLVQDISVQFGAYEEAIYWMAP